ncbi:hypothetical protein WEI85_05985 [Actinomycetes bacterium KLBMP 9797]
MSTRSSGRIAIRTLALAIMSGGLLMGAAAPAHASPDVSAGKRATTGMSAQAVGFWDVPEKLVYGNDPWPFAGQCLAWSHATYDPASNSLHVESRATNTSALAACRVRARLTLNLSFFGYTFQETVSRDIPTACSVNDVTCPGNPPAGVPGRGTGWDDLAKTFPPGMTLTSVTNYDVERRY